MIPSDGRVTMWLYAALIATRVSGFTLCDAVTGFWLSQLGTKAEEVARIDELKGHLHVQIAQSTGAHKKAAAEANLKVLKIDLEAEQARQRAEFHAELDRLMMQEVLQRQRSKLLKPPQETDGDVNDMP